MRRRKRSFKRRALNAICSLTLIGGGVYMFTVGISFISGIVVAAALLSVVAPVAIDGGGFFEMILGFFEALIDGVAAIFDGISNIFNF